MEESYKPKEKIKFDLVELPQVDDTKVYEVKCPSCGGSVPSEDCNIHDKVAKCSSCNGVFSLESQIKQIVKLSPEKHEIRKPEGVDVYAYKGEGQITLPQPISILYLVISLVLPMLLVGVTKGYLESGKAILFNILIGTVLIWSYSVYKLIRSRSEKILLTADKGVLTVHWNPNNFMRDKKYKIDTIKQLYVVKNESGIILNMIIDEGQGEKHVKLISRFTNIHKAKYVEQELENILQIDNHPVPGETT